MNIAEMTIVSLVQKCEKQKEKISDLRAENARLREALERLRDCDWVITLPDRMDAVRAIARAALASCERSEQEKP